MYSRHSHRGLIALSPQCVSRIPSYLDNKVTFEESDPQDLLFLPVPSCFFVCFFFVVSPTTHWKGSNKSTSDKGAPKQRSWNAVTTGRPLALFALPSFRRALALHRNIYVQTLSNGLIIDGLCTFNAIWWTVVVDFGICPVTIFIHLLLLSSCNNNFSPVYP